MVYRIIALNFIIIFFFSFQTIFAVKKLNKKSVKSKRTIEYVNKWKNMPYKKAITRKDMATFMHMLMKSGEAGGKSYISLVPDSVAELFTHMTNKLNIFYDSVNFSVDHERNPFVMWKFARYYFPEDTVKGFLSYHACSTYYDTANLHTVIDSAYIDTSISVNWLQRVTRYLSLFPMANIRAKRDYNPNLRPRYLNRYNIDERDIALTGMMSEISDSLKGFTFLYKYNPHEAASYMFYMGNKIKEWVVGKDSVFTKRKRYTRSMWFTSKYAYQTFGKYLSGFESFENCQTIYDDRNWNYLLNEEEFLNTHTRMYYYWLKQYLRLYERQDP